MKKYFGGKYLVHKRKSQRPLDKGKIIHLVLRLKDNLPAFFSPRDEKLRSGFYQIAKKHQIEIKQLIFNHTHVHLAILSKDRQSYVAFIRELTSKIVSYLSKSIGIRLKNIFEYRPFTRIVTGLRGLLRLDRYMRKNERESKVLQCHRNPGLYSVITQTHLPEPSKQFRFF